MNNDLISRSALFSEINSDREAAKAHPQEICERFSRFCDYAEVLVEQAPTVDAEPVRHARWLPTNDDNNKRCSGCDIIHLIAQYPHGQANYCPNCGAKMTDGDTNAD